MSQQPNRSLPSIEALLSSAEVTPLVAAHGRELVTYAARGAVADARERVSAGTSAPTHEHLVAAVSSMIRAIALPQLVPVINAAGVVVHTNLGRAPMGRRLLDEIAPAMTGYCNLEFDLRTGRRGHRVDHVREILRYLTGADDVAVVNNNAAALILALSTLAKRREVIVSRGELIEIGGAFRIPEIMAASGARMVEVGTTNRTRLSDYESAITSKTAILFKAHRSNFSVTGFTEEASVKDLSALAESRGLIVVYDIGSGLLRMPRGSPLSTEPDVRTAVSEGAHLVAFSCDKLMGGPQAGVIAGRADLVARLSKAPLMRALRVGKLTMAALSSACRNYLDDRRLFEANPAFAMFTSTPEGIRSRAEQLASLLSDRGVACTIEASSGQAGGGSLPDAVLPSWAVALTPPLVGPRARQAFGERVFRALLALDTPVLAILREGRVLLDVLTVQSEEVAGLAEAVRRVVE